VLAPVVAVENAGACLDTCALSCTEGLLGYLPKERMDRETSQPRPERDIREPVRCRDLAIYAFPTPQIVSAVFGNGSPA